MNIKVAQVGGEYREAWYSDCYKYRYLLDIIWGMDNPIMTTIALNPSTATELVNDPTIMRCIGFAKALGFGGYRMLNAFAFRATDRRLLRVVNDPVGHENTLEFLAGMSTDMVIACWGRTIQDGKWKHWYRGHDIACSIPRLKCFRLTGGRHPEHPLYLPANTKPFPFKYNDA